MLDFAFDSQLNTGSMPEPHPLVYNKMCMCFRRFIAKRFNNTFSKLLVAKHWSEELAVIRFLRLRDQP